MQGTLSRSFGTCLQISCLHYYDFSSVRNVNIVLFTNEFYKQNVYKIEIKTKENVGTLTENVAKK